MGTRTRGQGGMGPGAAGHELWHVDGNDGEEPGRDGAGGSKARAAGCGWERRRGAGGGGEELKVSGAGGYGGGAAVTV
jgi:hypothetical protein